MTDITSEGEENFGDDIPRTESDESKAIQRAYEVGDSI
jgi:hypothetical protein